MSVINYMGSDSRLRNKLLQILHVLDSAPVHDIVFERAVEESLAAKAGRRARTLAEISSVCRGLMKRVPGLGKRSVASMNRAYCAELLQTATTHRQMRKLRTILHGVFSYCCQQEWCLVNPVSCIHIPAPEEREIEALEWNSLRELARCARLKVHRCCMPGLGLMLWAGVRPAEVMRLNWADIDWDDSIISVRPVHSKTGGCRHIQLQKVLRVWLQEYGVSQGKICPPNWHRRWRLLRDAAGLVPWQQDVLRHTFASYHVKYFHDFPRLQEDMGHHSATLLRTRYLNMRGLTAAHAQIFWKPGGL